MVPITCCRYYNDAPVCVPKEDWVRVAIPFCNSEFVPLYCEAA